MSRVSAHTVGPSPAPGRDTVRSLEARFGKVLTIPGAMAHSPLVLDAYAALQHGIAEHGTLDGRTRQAIALVVAAVDQYSYCQAAHTAGEKTAGLTEAEAIDTRRGSTSDVELQALLPVVREQMTDLGNVSDASGQAAWLPAGPTPSSPRSAAPARRASRGGPGRRWRSEYRRAAGPSRARSARARHRALR
jgi:AhpD family alkylhydroperoxidase